MVNKYKQKFFLGFLYLSICLYKNNARKSFSFVSKKIFLPKGFVGHFGINFRVCFKNFIKFLKGPLLKHMSS